MNRIDPKQETPAECANIQQADNLKALSNFTLIIERVKAEFVRFAAAFSLMRG